MSAKLRYSYGTMSSGKSLQLLTIVYNFEQRNIDFSILKSCIDTRDGSEIKSRIGDDVSRSCVLIDTETNIIDLYRHLARKPKWLFIDESQFLTEDQVDQLSYLVDYMDIEVWCFGLRTDFKTNLFTGSKRLFEVADKLDEIKSMCECGRKNQVNARIDKNGNLISNGDQILVGDSIYKAICRKCYNDLIK